MKVSLPRSMAIKVNRVTPRRLYLEVERLKKWIAQIREAGNSL